MTAATAHYVDLPNLFSDHAGVFRDRYADQACHTRTDLEQVGNAWPMMQASSPESAKTPGPIIAPNPIIVARNRPMLVR